MRCLHASWTALVIVLVIQADRCLGTRNLASLYEPPPTILKYHSGEMLEGDIPISIVWYGKFTSTQRSVIHDFLFSVTPHSYAVTPIPSPSVSKWWTTVDDYLQKAGKNKTQILPANQITDVGCSIGGTLSKQDIATLASRAGAKPQGITVVLTDVDVAVEGFCVSNCGFHSSMTKQDVRAHSSYIWVGNSASQCPEKCAWPFHQPVYGPQVPPLVPPNNDVGLDGLVMNLATLLAGAVTNPFGNGLFQGPKDAPVEVAAVCPGVYGKGAYPGYPGDLLVDGRTGGSYNAHGLNGRKFLLPAMIDPSSMSCSTLV